MRGQWALNSDSEDPAREWPAKVLGARRPGPPGETEAEFPGHDLGGGRRDPCARHYGIQPTSRRMLPINVKLPAGGLPGPRRRREQGHRGPGVPGARTPADPSGLRPPPSPHATGHRSPGVASGPCPSRRDSDEPDLPRPIIIIIVLIRSADRAVPLRLVTVRPPLPRLYRHIRTAVGY
jgi:hypothetical protein